MSCPAAGDNSLVASYGMTLRLMRGALTLVPRPLVLATSAYVGFVGSAADIVAHPFSSLGIGVGGGECPRMPSAVLFFTVRPLRRPDISVPMDPSMTLCLLQQHAEHATGVPISQQTIWILEERFSMSGGDASGSLGDVVRFVQRTLRKRPTPTMTLLGWINYLLLPEVINREWNGQGMISWARSHVYAPLKRRCDGVRNTRVAVNIVPLQRSQVSVEFDDGATVGQVLAAVEEDAGVPRGRQCIVVTERAAPSVVVRGADYALSRWLRGVKLTVQAAAATKLAVDAELEALQAFGTRQYATRALQGAVTRYLGWGQLPMTVHVPSATGRALMFDVPPDMRIGELADLIRERQAASAEEAGAAADSNPADRIPMLVTPRRSQPRRASLGSPTAATPARDAVSPGCLPAVSGRPAPVPPNAVDSGAAACAVALPPPQGVMAMPHNAPCSGSTTAYLALPSPRRLLSSLTAVVGGSGGKAEAAGAASRQQSALMEAPTSAVALAIGSGGLAVADSHFRGMRKSGSFSIAGAVASPLAMFSLLSR